MGARAYKPRRLIEVEERRAEEEERRDHEVREECGNANGVVGLSAQQEDEHEPGQEVRDREGRQRSERMHVVGAGEGQAASDGGANTDAFHDGGRNRKPEEGEPRDRREDEEKCEKRRGGENDAPNSDCDEQVSQRRPPLRDDDARGGECAAQQHGAHRGGEEQLPGARRERRNLVQGRKAKTERERGPEAAPIQPDRLCDELPDGSRLGGKRRRKRL